MTTAGITVALLLHAGNDANPFKQLDGLMTKPEVRSVVGSPDGVEVLKMAECWSYRRREGITRQSSASTTEEAGVVVLG
jgi:hypothetical protein